MSTLPLASSSPLRRLLGSLLVAAAPAAIALLATACDAEEAECARDEECNEITCPDGSKMRTCQDGVCLQGDDCDAETSGGW